MYEYLSSVYISAYVLPYSLCQVEEAPMAASKRKSISERIDNGMLIVIVRHQKARYVAWRFTFHK